MNAENSLYHADNNDNAHDAFSDMVVKNLQLVKKIAKHLIYRLPANIHIDDLVQAGMLGLMEACKNYDKNKGANFDTYASIRIKGAMLDEMRRGDWVPRSVHKNTRRIAAAVKSIENKKGGGARDFEIAAELNISMDEYHQMLIDTKMAKIFAFEDENGQDSSFSALVDKTNCANVFEKTQMNRFKEIFAEILQTLSEREALVLSLYYDEDLNLREIGEIIGVSESRISQIHSQAMHKIKARMKGWEE